jgi:hypothetical protein
MQLTALEKLGRKPNVTLKASLTRTIEYFPSFCHAREFA